LPTGATDLAQGYLPALSCPSAGDCSAAGAFDDANGAVQGLLLDQVSGTWGPAQMLLVPSDAATNPFLTIYSLSCPSGGNCGVAGSYQVSSGDVQSFVANETASNWTGAIKVTLPANALSAGQDSQVKAVSCASAGNCSAVGTYLDSTAPFPRTLGFTLNEVHGSWGHATTLQLPSNANFNPFVTVNQLVCSSPGNCVAVGSYIDSNNANRGLLFNEVKGSWSAPKALTLPGNANAYPLASLSEVTCVSAGNCVAIGTYANNTGALEGLSVTESAGVWGRAQALTMPADAAASPHVFLYGFNGVSCSSVGNCSAGGQYRDRSSNYQGFLVSEVNGVWSSAVEMTLPAGALSGGRNGGVVAVSCPSDGNCSAGAAYLDGTGNYQALVINEVDSTWMAGRTVTLPAGATAVGVAGGIYSLLCTASGPCTATGSYLDATTGYQGFTLSSN
jgi:hypothetical protein